MSLSVLAANAERTPLAQWMITGADLSVIRFSTELSSVPRGMWTAPGMAPCSYSSGSRTSSTTAPGRRRNSSASAVPTSRISDLVAASSSRKLGMGDPLDTIGVIAVNLSATEKSTEWVNNLLRGRRQARGHRFRLTEPEVVVSGSGTDCLDLDHGEPMTSGTNPRARSGFEGDLVEGLDEVTPLDHRLARRGQPAEEQRSHGEERRQAADEEADLDPQEQVVARPPRRHRQGEHPRCPTDRLVAVPTQRDHRLGARQRQHVEAAAGRQEAHRAAPEV